MSKCDMFFIRSGTIVFFFILSAAVRHSTGTKLYEDGQNDEDDSLDCNDGRRLDDPTLLPFLEKLRGQEMIPSKMKEWVVYFTGEEDYEDLFSRTNGWNHSFLTEVGLAEDNQGVPYGNVFFTETTNVYLPRLKPISEEVMEFKVMYAEQLLLDAIDRVKIFVGNVEKVATLSTSATRILQMLLRHSNPKSITIADETCNKTCKNDNILIALESCGTYGEERYEVKCVAPEAMIQDGFFSGSESYHYDKSITPESRVELPVQLKQELQNMLDWMLKRISKRMKNYVEMSFNKNKFRRPATDLYNKVNLQISKIKGGRTFEAARSSSLIYTSLFDLNVYLNVTNTPYTFDKFHTFNLYLDYISQFTKWQLDTTKYANFFEPLKDLCMSFIGNAYMHMKPAKKIFELEDGVYDLAGTICHENTLYIVSGMTTINTIKSGLFDGQDCQFDTIFVLAKRNLTINEDLKVPGKNMVVFAPTWIIYKEQVIDLSGKSGVNGSNMIGQNGGDFIGFGLRFERSELLRIESNGGSGSNGRNTTRRVDGGRLAKEKRNKCVISASAAKEVLQLHGPTPGAPGGSPGAVTIKILRHLHNVTIVRNAGKDGRPGKMRNITVVCKNKKTVTIPVQNFTNVEFVSSESRKLNESEVLDVFRKIIRKNSQRLSYDVLSFYKDVWTSPLVGETLDSTLNDFLNNSDYSHDSREFYEVTSHILHSQIRQNCNMTNTQKVLLDFALATIRMKTPVEGALPTFISIDKYLEDVSERIGKTDIGEGYFKKAEGEFIKIIEIAIGYLKESLLPSLNKTISETHNYLESNAEGYLTNGQEAQKFQMYLVVNSLLRYFRDLFLHVQVSLDDFVKDKEEVDAVKMEKKLYFFRHTRNNITAQEMKAMVEFIKLLKTVVEAEEGVEDICATCQEEGMKLMERLKTFPCSRCTDVVAELLEEELSDGNCTSPEGCSEDCSSCKDCQSCPNCADCAQKIKFCSACPNCLLCPWCPQCRSDNVTLALNECHECGDCSDCPDCPQCQPVEDCDVNPYARDCSSFERDKECGACNNCFRCPDCNFCEDRCKTCACSECPWCSQCISENNCADCRDCSRCPNCQQCTDICPYCHDCRKCPRCPQCQKSDCQMCTDCYQCPTCPQCPDPCLTCLDCLTCPDCPQCTDQECSTCVDCEQCPHCPHCELEVDTCRTCVDCSTCPECPHCDCDICSCQDCPMCPKCRTDLRQFDEIDASPFEWPTNRPQNRHDVYHLLSKRSYGSGIQDEICFACFDCRKCPQCPQCNDCRMCSCQDCPQCQKCTSALSFFDGSYTWPSFQAMLWYMTYWKASEACWTCTDCTKCPQCPHCLRCNTCPCEICPLCPKCSILSRLSLSPAECTDPALCGNGRYPTYLTEENCSICMDCNLCPECSKCFAGYRFDTDDYSSYRRKSPIPRKMIKPAQKKPKKSRIQNFISRHKPEKKEELNQGPCSPCAKALETLKSRLPDGKACDAKARNICEKVGKVVLKSSDYNQKPIHLKCPECNDTLEFFMEKLSAEIGRCEQETKYDYHGMETSCRQSDGVVFHVTGCDPETYARTYIDIRENFMKEFSQFVASDDNHSDALDHVQNNFAFLLSNIEMLMQEDIDLSQASLFYLLNVSEAVVKFRDLKTEFQKRITELHDFSETDMYDLFSAELSMQNEKLGMTSKWLSQLRKLTPWMRKVSRFLGVDQKFQEVNERITEAIRLITELGYNVRVVERHRELHEYIKRVKELESENRITASIRDLMPVLEKTITTDVYNRAVRVSENWMFPLTKSFLSLRQKLQESQNDTYQVRLTAIREEIETHRKSIMLYTTVNSFDSSKNEVSFYQWNVRTRPTLMEDLVHGKPVILVSEILDGGKKNSLMAKDFEIKFVAHHRQDPEAQSEIDSALTGTWLNITHSGISYFKFGSRIYRRLSETYTFRHTAGNNREKVKPDIDYVLSPYTTWVLQLLPNSDGSFPVEIKDKIGSIELIGTGRYVINCAEITDVNQYFTPLKDYSRRNEK